MIKLLLLCLLLNSPALIAGEFRHFNEWTNKEKAELLAYSSLAYLDYRQTAWAIEQRDSLGNPLFSERNPAFGRYPEKNELIATQIIATGFYYYLVGKNYDPLIRGSILGIRLAAVIHNDSIGARIYKVF